MLIHNGVLTNKYTSMAVELYARWRYDFYSLNRTTVAYAIGTMTDVSYDATFTCDVFPWVGLG